MAIRIANPALELRVVASGLAVGGAVALTAALLIGRSAGLPVGEPYIAPQVELPTAAPIAPSQVPFTAEPSVPANRAGTSQNPAPAVEPASAATPTVAPVIAPTSPNRTTNLSPSRFADDPFADVVGQRSQTLPGPKFRPAGTP